MQGKQGAAGNPQHITHTVCLVCLAAKVGIKVEEWVDEGRWGGGLCVLAETSCRSPPPLPPSSTSLHKSFSHLPPKRRLCDPRGTEHITSKDISINLQQDAHNLISTSLQTIRGGGGSDGQRGGPRPNKQKKTSPSLLQPLCVPSQTVEPRKALKKKIK